MRLDVTNRMQDADAVLNIDQQPLHPMSEAVLVAAWLLDDLQRNGSILLSVMAQCATVHFA